jgi:hypothetical protein
MSNTLKFGNGQWGTKVGSALAYNDLNGNFKPLPFDFTRSTLATRINKDGLIEVVTSNKPRIDYKDDSEGALLLEPSRTNLETKSNEFSTWGTNSNITRTAYYIISPDGTLNGTRLQFTANGFCANTTQINSTQYTVTCYAKRNNTETQNVGFFTNGSGVVNSAWEITSEWKRFTYTYTSGNSSFVGIAGVSGADISVYGFQVEQGSYATSYIPTQGGVVTRLADSCNNGGNEQVINSTEGVFYFEGSALADDGTNRYLSLNDGTTNNYIYFRYVSTSNQYLFRTQVGGTIVNTLFGFLNDATQNHKFAFKFKSGDYAMWVDGVEISTDTSSTIFTSNTLSNLEYSFPTDGGDGFASKTRDIKVYNTALTDQELQALTTI